MAVPATPVTVSPERIVHANGVELCVQTFGSAGAAPVLLIAGAASSMLYWQQEFCERLAAGSRFVIRYDHRDTGRSTTDPPGRPSYTAIDLIDDVIGVLDALQLPRAHLVGLSMGGGLAPVAAVQHPERVASLTLIATSPGGPGEGDDLPSMSDRTVAEFEAVPEPDWADRESVIEHLVEQERLCAARSQPFDAAGMRADMARVVDRSPSIRSMFNHFAVGGGESYRKRLGEIAAPTLVLHGDEDPIFPPPHGVALAAEIRNARLITLPGVGHELPRRAWDAVVPAILAHTAGADDR
jgi:pimeloyl-ACP methyl ester carboxylesterase